MFKLSETQGNTLHNTSGLNSDRDFDVIDADIEVFSERFLCLRNRLGHRYRLLSWKCIIFSGQRLKPQRSDVDPQFGWRRVGHRVATLLPDAFYVDDCI